MADTKTLTTWNSFVIPILQHVIPTTYFRVVVTGNPCFHERHSRSLRADTTKDHFRSLFAPSLRLANPIAMKIFTVRSNVNILDAHFPQVLASVLASVLPLEPFVPSLHLSEATVLPLEPLRPSLHLSFGRSHPSLASTSICRSC